MGWHLLPEPIYVDRPEQMEQVCRHVRDTGISGIDTETTGLDLSRDHVLFWSLAPDSETRYCLSRRMLPIFRDELGDDPNITWIMTNANFDNNMLANSGVPLLAGKIFCTLVEDWLVDENKPHGLKECAQRHLDLNMRQFKQVFKKKRGETYQDTLLRMMEQQPADAIDYASMDAWASLAVHYRLKDRLERIQTSTGLTMWDLFYNVEVPYTKVLYNCIRRGIMVDIGWLEEIREPITRDMEQIQFQFNKIAGEEVNLNSPKQLREIFIDRLGYKPIKWTSGGASGNKQPSVDESVLKRWAEDGDELAGLVVQFRGLSKTRGTYVDGMIERCDPRLRIHPMLTQSVTVTGRLSSRDPNLQNIPRPDDDVYGLRGAFMPGTGYTLVAADYAQLEMRLLAQMSNDRNMQKVILDGKDIHMGTAALMYDQDYDEIAKAKKESKALEDAKVPFDQWPERMRELLGYRQDAKSIGFGINYGKGDQALAVDLKITKEEAARRKEKYFAPYPQVRQFIEFTHNYCRDYLEVSTILGRKRRLPEADHDWRDAFYHRKYRKWVPEKPGPIAARALRQDVNSIIQGSAADVARMAQIECEESEELAALGVRQILQIHDEILFEVPTEHLKQGCQVIKDIMERPFWNLPERLGLEFRELAIPLDVDVGHGEAWSEAH